MTPEASHVPLRPSLPWTALAKTTAPKGSTFDFQASGIGDQPCMVMRCLFVPVPAASLAGAGGHIAPSVHWVRPRHWPISCVSKRPDSRNAKALAARVSSAGPTVAPRGTKRDELGLRDYLRGTSTETRLYVPTVSGFALRLSDERTTARLSSLVYAREEWENVSLRR